MFGFKAYAFVKGLHVKPKPAISAPNASQETSPVAPDGHPVPKPASPGLSKTKRLVGIYVDGSNSALMIHTEEADDRQASRTARKMSAASRVWSTAR